MQVTASFKMPMVVAMLRKRGLEDKGKVQAFIDSECIRQMDPYTPSSTAC